MENIVNILLQCPLFAQMSAVQIGQALQLLSPRQKQLKKDAFIFTAGDNATAVGIVLTGSAYVVQEDFWGNRTILANLSQGDLFGESFPFALAKTLPVSVIAQTACTVLLLDCKKMIGSIKEDSVVQQTLIQNMLAILAQKNMMLTQKIELVTKRSIKEKVLAYLSMQALSAKQSTFIIPFNRQELADYLSVDRSALSSTLSKMRDEGLLTFYKNQFTLITK